MKQIFDNYINNSFDGEKKQAYFKIQQFNINYKKFFPKEKSSKVLDIGIGRGEMLSCMKNWGYSYSGLDITKSTVEYCKSIDLSCEYAEDSIGWLKTRPDSYDVITLLDVIEHVSKEDALAFLQAIFFALKKGGTVILQTPNMQAVDSNLHRYNDITHEIGLTEHSFKQLLIQSGFEEFNFYGFEWMVGNRLKHKIGKLLRYIQHKKVYISRRIAGNLNPKILHPVFFAVAKK